MKLQPTPGNANIITKTKLATEIGLVQASHFTLVTPFAGITAAGDLCPFYSTLRRNCHSATIVLTSWATGRHRGIRTI
jgi:hypothetical protein